ncbi:MAG: DUF4145 domain-containing protein [Geminicoccaceae bacterium]|nr:DUF4145 domain-containing protein [Geminicoccaceae bacterium]
MNAIKDKIDSDVWQAIDAVRKLGNIGAHMERNTSIIVDIDPGEASLMIEILEQLFDDWYTQRHERQKRL